MSQHIFFATDAKGDPVTVTLGYDRPLDYVFCIVVRESDDSGRDEEDFVYTNLDDENAGIEQQSVEYYRQVLQNLGIQVPESMFREVRADQVGCIGNRMVVHSDE